MDKKYNGGPVFPCAVNSAAKEQAKSVGIILEDYTGMTLRDYFAAKAMLAIITDPATANEDFDEEVVSHNAFKLADAMLKARE